jgi:hypothetical protein
MLRPAWRANIEHMFAIGKDLPTIFERPTTGIRSI